MLPALKYDVQLSRYFGCFHQDKDDLEGEDEDNPLVVACIRSIVSAVKSSAFSVVLVHYAFHVRLIILV